MVLFKNDDSEMDSSKNNLTENDLFEKIFPKLYSENENVQKELIIRIYFIQM